MKQAGDSQGTARPPRPTDGELEILRVLWADGPSSVRAVHQSLAVRKRTTFNTTLKLLQIMFDKGLVTRDSAGRPHIYSAAIPEALMQRQLVSDLLERAFGGAAGKLVAALMPSDINGDELAAIRRVIVQYGENDNERSE